MNTLKKTTYSIALLSAVFSVSAIAQPYGSHPQGYNPTTQPTSTVEARAHGAYPRVGKILNTIMTIDKNEIDAANLALKKAQHRSVKRYAEMMLRDHSQNLQRFSAISHELHVEPLASRQSTLLQERGQRQLQRLASLPNQRFDAAYIHAMVKGHAEALMIIDTYLLPNAKKPLVIQYLKATRAKVEQHLHLAESIQHRLYSRGHQVIIQQQR